MKFTLRILEVKKEKKKGQIKENKLKSFIFRLFIVTSPNYNINATKGREQKHKLQYDP